MDPVSVLIAKLHQQSDLAYREASDGVFIGSPGPSGFSVELRSGTGEWTVFLGNAGFHKVFASAEEVLNFIAWCYSGNARVREVWRGSSPQKAILEAQADGEWHAVSETGFFLVPFWRKPREVVLANPSLP